MTSAEAFDRIAAVEHRLAVLLSAGVPPPNAWGYLAPTDAADSAASAASRPAPHNPVAAVARAVRAGVPVEAALRTAAEAAADTDREAWQALAEAWLVATASGAPLGPTLLRMADAHRNLAQTAREMGVALAGPAATRRLVLWLPAVGLFFGIALGFDPLGVLLSNPIGWACAAAGTALLLLAKVWTSRLVSSAQPKAAVPGMDLDLLAIALSSGGSTPRAVEILRQEAGREAGEAARRVLDLASRAGVPAAELLRAEADLARREHLAAAQIRVSRLGVTLLLPLGVCVLPAFVALGVAPLLLSVLTQTMGRF